MVRRLQTWHFHGLHIRSFSNSFDLWQAHMHTYPTFELSNAVLSLAKLLLESESWGQGPEIPYCWEIPSLTLPQYIASFIKSRHQLDSHRPRYQYAQDEWSRATSPWLSIIGMSGLTSLQEVVQAEMLPHTNTTNPYYFPSTESACQWHSHSVDINIKQGFPAGSTKDALTCYFPRPELQFTFTSRPRSKRAVSWS